MQGTYRDPIRISSLLPGEDAMDKIEAEQRLKLLSTSTLADVIDAICTDDFMTPNQQEVLYDLIRHACFKPAGDSIMSHAAIGIMITQAFQKYVEKYADLEMAAAIQQYQDDAAQDLRDRGMFVDDSF